MNLRAALSSIVALSALATTTGWASMPEVAASPAQAAGIQARTSSPSTGLDGGETIVVDVSGLAPGAEFHLGQCADHDAIELEIVANCAPHRKAVEVILNSV